MLLITKNEQTAVGVPLLKLRDYGDVVNHEGCTKQRLVSPLLKQRDCGDAVNHEERTKQRIVSTC